MSFNAQRPWRRTHSQIFKPRKAHIKLLYVVTIPPGSVVVQSFIRVWLFATPWTANSCPLTRWCHPTISSSVTLFSSCPQSFPASGAFPMSRLFASGGQSIGASASVLPMNIQCWLPLGLTGLISLQSKGLSRVFSSTTVSKPHCSF